MSVLPAFMFVHHVSICLMPMELRVSDPLELELQLIVSHHVIVGNRIWVF